MDNLSLKNEIVETNTIDKIIYEGFYIDESYNWIYLKYIPDDFIIDGDILLNKQYFKFLNKSQNADFKNKILSLKKINQFKTESFELINTQMLSNSLMLKSKLVGIILRNYNVQYVGKIVATKEKSMKVHLLDNKCNWLKIETFRYNEIRIIKFDDDYLNSLNLFLDSENNN
jgi:hypothetical protein